MAESGDPTSRTHNNIKISKPESCPDIITQTRFGDIDVDRQESPET